jgi:hypothetical protein
MKRKAGGGTAVNNSRTRVRVALPELGLLIMQICNPWKFWHVGMRVEHLPKMEIKRVCGSLRRGADADADAG